MSKAGPNWRLSSPQQTAYLGAAAASPPTEASPGRDSAAQCARPDTAPDTGWRSRNNPRRRGAIGQESHLPALPPQLPSRIRLPIQNECAACRPRRESPRRPQPRLLAVFGLPVSGAAALTTHPQTILPVPEAHWILGLVVILRERGSWVTQTGTFRILGLSRGLSQPIPSRRRSGVSGSEVGPPGPPSGVEPRTPSPELPSPGGQAQVGNPPAP